MVLSCSAWADMMILLRTGSVIEHRTPKCKRSWNREMILIHRRRCPRRGDGNAGNGERVEGGVET